MGLECTSEAPAANVQDPDDKVARYAREAHKIPSPDKEMGIKIHKAEKYPSFFLLLPDVKQYKTLEYRPLKNC